MSLCEISGVRKDWSDSKIAFCFDKQLHFIELCSMKARETFNPRDCFSTFELQEVTNAISATYRKTSH